MTEQEEAKLLVSQWQTCVNMADSTSKRRDATNNLFLTIDLALVAAVSAIWEIKTVILLASGVLVCVIWLLTLRNFRLLNKAKFKVIHDLEAKLPAQPYDLEWEYLKAEHGFRAGSKLERYLPLMFIAVYAGLFIALLLK